MQVFGGGVLYVLIFNMVCDLIKGHNFYGKFDLLVTDYTHI